MAAGHKSTVFTSVAYSPTMLMAPVEFAMLAFGTQSALMLVSFIVFKISITVWVIPIILVHGTLILLYNKDPHLVSLTKSKGKFISKRHNISVEEDVIAKYTP